MTLVSVAINVNKMLNSMYTNAGFICSIILAALIVHIINYCFKNQLNKLGTIPRKPQGLPGLIFSPWLHGSFSHWFMNALFFFLLASMTLMIIHRQQFIYLCLFISIISGLLTWLMARRATHIGASGVIMGLWGFLLVNAFRNPSFTAIAIAVVVFYFLGGLFSSVLPKKDKSSWEGHLFGTIAGIGAAFIPWLTS